MEDGAADYIKTPLKAFPARELRETAEGRHWKGFRAALAAKHIGGVNSLQFCEGNPRQLAATSSTRVTLYDTNTAKVYRTIGRFSDKAYSGRFRSDGKLVAAGGEAGVVQVFDASSRGLLRQMKGHRRPVHVVEFAASKMHLLSGSDDATLRLWDVGSGLQVTRMLGHKDYVRAACANPVSADVWASGGYDHTCKLWDVRSENCIASLDHGAPVESLAFFPSGGVVVSAGGTYLRFWDLYRGGALLRQLSSHQKTITSVVVHHAMAASAQDGLRVMSGSLDGHVKVYDTTDFQVTHASKYPAPILSLAMSPDCATLAVGMADGLLSVRRRRASAATELDERGLGSGHRPRFSARLTAGSYRYFVRGQGAKAAALDYVVAARRKASLPVYDKLLRRFRYSEALDAALQTQRPEVVSTVVEELAARGGLAAALAGRASDSLLPVVQHLQRHISDPRHAHLMSSLAHRLLDMYGASFEGSDSPLSAKLGLVQERIRLELRLQEHMMSIKGMLEPLLSAAAR